MPNADNDGRIIIDMINQFVKIHPLNTTAITSMGQTNYLSTHTKYNNTTCFMFGVVPLNAQTCH